MTRVAALILAAGRSSRMRDHKLLLELGGLPLVRRVTLEAIASRACSVVVVLGHRADQVRAALGGLRVAFVSNLAYERGLSSSVASGIGALGDDVDGALVCLGDMPFVRSTDIDASIAAFRGSGGSSIVVPTYEGRRGNPVLWPRDLFERLAGLEGDAGGRGLLLEHMDRVLRLDADHPGVLLDIDTPEDLARLAIAHRSVEA